MSPVDTSFRHLDGPAAAVSVRTPTLPPATHTNCYVLGRDGAIIVDPASPWPDEQERLAQELSAQQIRVGAILLTHHHHDHVSGAADLKARLGVPVLAHPLTTPLVRHQVEVDEELTDGQLVVADGVPWRVLHTPGHAPGHVALHQEASGAIVAGDMVAGVGTIVLEPSEADLQDYLDSLQRLRELEPSVLHPSHGPPIAAADALLAYYIQHRNGRTASILDALSVLGPSAPPAIVERVYGDTIPDLARPLAARQVICHLRWLAQRGQVKALQAETGRWERT